MQKVSQLDLLMLGEKDLQRKVKNLDRRVRTYSVGHTGNSPIVIAPNKGPIDVDGGDVSVRGGGNIFVTDGGDIQVSDGGKVSVDGTGLFLAGTEGSSRTQLNAGGLAGFNSSNEIQVSVSSTDGKMKIWGPGSVVVQGGGSILAGNEGANRLELKQEGIFVYDQNGVETTSISTVDGIVRIDADAFQVAGTVNFDSLVVSGELVTSQDLRIGANILFVDTSQSNLGINKAPDPQFDLDVAGSTRVGGYIIGRHALQIKGATLICHWDGPEPVEESSLDGDFTSHLGHTPETAPGPFGSWTFEQGKFSKGLKLDTGSTVKYPTENVFKEQGSLCIWVKRETQSPGTERVISADFFSGNAIWLYSRQDGWGATLFANDLETSTPAKIGWTHLAVTWDGIDTIKLYEDGLLVDSGSYSGMGLKPNNGLWVGSDDQGNLTWHSILDELVIVDRVLEQEEILAIVESDAPVFAETSNWGFRTPNTLAWADSEGLWAVDSFGLAAFGVSGVDNKSWGNLGSTFLDRGDVLIGNSSQYVLWDASQGKMIFKGDGEGLTEIDGGNIKTGTLIADGIKAGAIDGETITGGRFYTAGTENVWMDDDGLSLATVYDQTFDPNYTAQPYKLSFRKTTDDNELQAYISSFTRFVGGDHILQMYSGSNTHQGQIDLYAKSTSGPDPHITIWGQTDRITLGASTTVANTINAQVYNAPTANINRLQLGGQAPDNNVTLYWKLHTPTTNFLLLGRDWGGATVFNVAGSGSAFLKGTLTQGSDLYLKENIRNLTNTKLKKRYEYASTKLIPVLFDYIDGDKDQLGFIAQQIEKHCPELVSEVEGTKTLNYHGIIALLVNDYKLLLERIEKLEENYAGGEVLSH